MKKTKANTSPQFCLRMPAGVDAPSDIERFLDAVLTATRNTVKRENDTLLKFKPSGTVATTYRGPVLNTAREQKNNADDKC